jgi:EF hand/EF-hand domain pair
VLVDKLFRAFDANRDGALNFRELAVGFARLAHLSQNSDEIIDMLFRGYDINGNGTLDEDEVTHMIKTTQVCMVCADRLNSSRESAVMYQVSDSLLFLGNFLTYICYLCENSGLMRGWQRKWRKPYLTAYALWDTLDELIRPSTLSSSK